jgi:tetratricopeptide (TPR) repeat protein
MRIACITLAISILGACTRQSFERFFLSGQHYLAAHRYAEAAIQFENAARINSASAETQLRLGDAYAALHEAANAATAHARACSLDDRAVAGCISAGGEFLALGDYTAAATQARVALARDRFNLDAALILASALGGVRRFAEAEERIAAALALAPQEPRVYRVLGQLQRQRGNEKAAESSLLKAVDLDPESAAARVSLARLYLETGRIDDGVQQLRQALQAEPKDLEASRLYGTYLVQSNQCQDAEQYWQNVVQQSSDESGPLALADYYVVSGRPKDALAVLNRLVAKDAAGEARSRIASITYDGGDHEGATRLADELLAKEPMNVNGFLLKARIALDDRDVSHAREYAHRAAEAAPDNPAVRQMLARLETGAR